MVRDSWYTFKDQTSTFVHKVPLNGLIHIVDSDWAGTSKYIQLTDLADITNNTTISDLLSTPAKWKEVNSIAANGSRGTLWDSGIEYSVGDLVTESEITYRATAISLDAQPSLNNNAWDPVGEAGRKWTATTTYEVGDITVEDEVIYSAKSKNVNMQPSLNLGIWAQYDSVVRGGIAWSSTKTYIAGDIVADVVVDGIPDSIYISRTTNLNKNPAANPNDWYLSTSPEIGGKSYIPGEEYVTGDIVTRLNIAYLCTSASSTDWATDSTNFKVIDSGGREWDNNVQYTEGDLATIGSVVYVCTSPTPTIGDSPAGIGAADWFKVLSTPATPGTDGTDGTDGLLTDADKFKLDGIEALAEVNRTDVETSTLMKDYVEVLTNKDLTDNSNHIHARRVESEVVNNTGTSLVKGTPVTIEEYTTYSDAVATDQATMIANGIVADTITDSSTGMIVATGLLTGIDTSSYAEGTLLYVGNGDLVSVEPTSGFVQPIAVVLRDHATEGAIQILAAYPKQDADDVRFNPASSTLIDITTQAAIDSLDSRVVTNDAKVSNVTTNLTKTATTTDVTIESSDGTNVGIGAASTSNAGVMTKAIYDEHVVNNGKVSNISTALSNGTPSTTLVNISSDGSVDDVSIAAANTVNAGVMTKAMYDQHVVNTAKTSNIPTALSAGTISTTVVNITSDGATDDVALAAASATRAGVMTRDMYNQHVVNNAKVSNVSTSLSVGTISPSAFNITSDGGANDLTIPSVNSNDAGVMTATMYTEHVANNNKVTNVTTNLSLGTNTGTTLGVNSSDGADVTLPAAATGVAGLLSGSDKDKLDGIESGATADQTKADIDLLGINADTVDGTHLSAITHSGDSVALTGDVTGSTTVGADGTISIVTAVGNDSHTHAFSNITSKPTTIAGYGITDGVQEGDSVTLTGDVTGTASFDTSGNVSITTVVADDSHAHITGNIDGLAEYISDTVGNMVTANSESGLSVVYQDTDNTLDFALTADPVITLGGDLSGSATLTNLGSATLTATITANSIDSDSYIDGSIDRVHLAADIIDGTKIANDVINSEHYVAGSIDNEHIADNAINSEHYADNSIDALHLNVSGNGTTSQYLRSDADGSFTWATPPNTVYSHPTHPGDDFSVDSGVLTGATVISDIDINVTTDTLGHVTDANGVISTRTLTAANIGATTAFTYTTKTANYTAVADNFIYANTSGGAFTITLPASPSANTIVSILDSTGSFETNNITVARNGKTIMGLTEDMVLSTNYLSVELLYTGADWRIV